ncbi:MAG: heavy metal translocating P-type ATPase [Gammaproteobacteria bacterium]|nr:heavy metal translocating P-type ATPase [Gammaproteobacteria bacterium]
MSTATAVTASLCYHCAQPIPAGIDIRARIDGADRPMCCHGCRAVAEAIVAGGLGEYYRRRTGPAATADEPVPAFLREIEAYDNRDVQRALVRDVDGGARETALILEGIECAACAWLNERYLARLPGVLEARVNFSTHRARVRFDPDRLSLSDIVAAVKRIGYRAHPYDPARHEALLGAERSRSLRRIGVAGALGMQVMMIAVVLYAGEWYGMETHFRRLFEWVSLLLTAPVLLYSARGFFAGALRDLANGRTGMDVPVALGLGIAFAGSVHATLAGHGAVYYDSVVMFVFALLLARHLELMARQRCLLGIETLVSPAPTVAVRLAADGAEQVVAVAELAPGDRVLVRPGAALPVDGRVLDGRSTVDEALLTGESAPVAKGPGDAVTGGAVNMESPLEIEVLRTGPDTVLSRLLDLAERAQAERPRVARLADGVAGWFVAAVLVLAACVALYWWHEAPARWLPITVAVLVVTCPCALSLATPTALTAASSALARCGLVVTGAGAVETLARADRVVFDKTGTLTEGRVRLVECRALSDLGAERSRSIAAALERRSEHPLARALGAAGAVGAGAQEVVNVPGQGLHGVVDGARYFLGAPGFVAAEAGVDVDHALLARGAERGWTVALLADTARVHAVFYLADRLRPGAAALVRSLEADGIAVSLYSGDWPAAVARVASELGIRDHAGSLSPHDKLARMHAHQARGETVAMVGDGINDAPVLAGADVSIAMGHGAQAARARADILVLRDDLAALAAGVRIARRSLRIIAQNLIWAVAYNLIAVPAAAAGWVAPWMAALGMSLSSIAVVANSVRVGRKWTFFT